LSAPVAIAAEPMTRSDHHVVAVPGTSRLDGRAVVGARVRPVTGREELLVADALADASSVVLVDELLTSCVASIRLAGAVEDRAGAVEDLAGAVEDLAGAVEDRAELGRLTVGDREVLLLRIRQASFGPTLDLVVSCPDARCGEPMDLRLDLDDLCRGRAEPVAAHEAVIGRSDMVVRFRLPTGADQAAVSEQALDDPIGAGRALARACLIGSDPDDLGWGPDELDELGDVLAGLDPHADIELSLVCPECGRAFLAPLDAAELLRDELRRRRRDLDVEVHLLASHYHWTEAAILDLPSDRRRRYVEVLSDALRPASAWD
jgi:hypothetical protein